MSEERKFYVFCENNCRFEGMTKEQIVTAIAEATGSAPSDVDSAFITKIKEMNQNKAIKFWFGTTAQFAALSEKAEDTLYILTDDDTEGSIEVALSDLTASVQSIVAGDTVVGNAANAQSASNADSATNATFTDFTNEGWTTAETDLTEEGFYYFMYDGISFDTQFGVIHWEDSTTSVSALIPSNPETYENNTYRQLMIDSTGKIHIYERTTGASAADLHELTNISIFCKYKRLR